MSLNKKGLKLLKKAWPKVKKKGGYFALATNGFPGDPEAVPVLLFHTNQAFAKADVARLTDGVDLAKLAVGRVEAEDSLRFHIDEGSSKLKNPELLRKSLKHLAGHPSMKDLKLGKLLTAKCQTEVATEQIEMATTEDLKATGGKASLKSKLFGGTYAKLLSEVKDWQKRFDKGVAPKDLPKAAAALAKLREKATRWLHEYGDTGDTGKTVAGLLVQLERADTQIHRRQAELAAANRVADQTAEQADAKEAFAGLPGDASTADVSSARKAVMDAQRGGSEALVEQLQATQSTKALAGLSHVERARVLDAKAATVAALVQQADDMTSMVKTIVARGGTHKDASEHTNSMLQMIDALRESGNESAAAQVEAKLVDCAVELSVATAAADHASDPSTLLRGSGPDSGMRGELLKTLGAEAAPVLVGSIDAGLGEQAWLPPKDIEDPEARAAAEAKITEAIRAFLDPLIAHPENLPPKLLKLVSTLATSVVAATRDASAAVGIVRDAVFLRWLNGQMMSIQAEAPDGEQKTPPGRLLVAKLVQRMVNATATSTEDEEPFSGLVEEYTPQLQAWMAQVVEAGTRIDDSAVVVDSDVPEYGDRKRGNRLKNEEKRAARDAKAEEKRARLRARAEEFDAEGPVSPQAVWSILVIKVQDAASQIEFEVEGVVMRGREIERWMKATFLPAFKAALPEGHPDLLSPGVGGPPAFTTWHDRIRDALREEARQAAAGVDGPVFEAKVLYATATEHWDDEIQPLFNGLWNSIGVKDDYQRIEIIDLEACFTESDLVAQHAAWFDERPRGMLTEPARFDAGMKALYRAAAAHLTAELDRVRDGGTSDYFRLRGE